MKNQKVIYYSDLLNDDFSGTAKNKLKITNKYRYIITNPIYKIVSFIVYRIIVTPIAFIYIKFIKKVKFENKKVLKQCKNSGYFVYGNHTNNVCDAFNPTVMNFPKKTYIIVNPDNLDLPVLKKSTRMMGALPLPSSLSASKNFMYAVEKRVVQGHPVIVYPEAHIWPYYTKIRPFKSVSFKYPVKFNEPSFCATTTYQKHKRKHRMVVYVDGPFYANKSLPSEKEQQEDLRNRIYETMVERSKNSNIEIIKYIEKEKHND